MSQALAEVRLAVVVPEQPTPPEVTETEEMEPSVATLALAWAVHAPENASGTVAP